MKRLGMVLVVTGLVVTTFVPLSSGMAQSLALEVKQVWFVNKSPFILEGKTEPGSIIEVHDQGINIKVDDNGFFNIELKIEEGINLFAITASKDGLSSTKSVMVEMDSSPNDVTFFIDGELVSDKSFETQTKDASAYTLIGFTKHSSTIIVDEEKLLTNSTKFVVGINLQKAPSINSAEIIIIDKFGNESHFKIKVTNIHVRVVKMKLDSNTVYIDDKEITIPYPPMSIRSAIMMPVRPFIEQVLNGRLEYDLKTRTATCYANGNILSAQIGNLNAVINGKTIMMPLPTPLSVNDRFYIGAKFLCDSFNYKFIFYQPTREMELNNDIYP